MNRRTPTPSTARLTVRCTPEELARWMMLAKAAGVNLSELVRGQLNHIGSNGPQTESEKP